MKHIVIDLEMNRISNEYSEERQLCNMEIIEIGAVVLDENYQEIGHFKTLVKPQFNNRIESYYEQLTGITTTMVNSAPVFSDAIKQFLSWCNSIGDDFQIYQWSNSDLNQIMNELELKHIFINKKDMRLLVNWIDFQREYGNKLGFNRELSLKDAVMYAGINFDGRQHDALHDARNTAHLLEILRIPEKCANILGKVIDVLNPVTSINSIGSLIDLSQFNFT